MRGSRFLLTFTPMLALLVPSAAASQSGCNFDEACPWSVEAQVDAAAVLDLGPSPFFTDFGIIGVDDLGVGYKDAPDPLLVAISANTGWVLNIHSDLSTWFGGDDLKPVSDLLWSTTAPGSTPMSTADAQVKSGSAVEDDLTTIYFRSLWSFADDPPGTYDAILRLTLSAN